MLRLTRAVTVVLVFVTPVLLTPVLVTLLRAPLQAQSSTTSLRGTVTDPQGAVLPGASVTLSNSSNGFSESKKTDRDGVYQFLQLPPGTYTLTVTNSG